MCIKKIVFSIFSIFGEILVFIWFQFDWNSANYVLKFLLQFVLTTTLPAKIQTVFLQVSKYVARPFVTDAGGALSGKILFIDFVLIIAYVWTFNKQHIIGTF